MKRSKSSSEKTGMSRKTASLLGLLGLIIVLFLINAVSRNLFSRFYLDLTQDRLYSLSSGTSKILSKISEPITLKFYFSRTDGAKYPTIKLYGSRILDLLQQYSREAKGKVNLEIYDPRPDSEEEEWADKYGLSAIPGQVGEKLYLGLAGSSSLGAEEVIPLFNFSRQEYLEYDITKLVSNLLQTKKPLVGVMSPINVMSPSMPEGMGSPPDQQTGWFAFSQLAQSLELKTVATDAKSIDSDIDLLLVVHPKGLKDETLFAIDQFVMRGGRLMVFVDPYCQADQDSQTDPNNPMAGMMRDRESNLNKLLVKWGVEMPEKKILGDIGIAARVNTGGAPGESKSFVVWPNLTRDQVSTSDVVASNLESLVFAWAGVLNISKIDGVETEVLLHSSPKSQLLDDSAVRFGGGEPDALLRTFIPTGKEQAIAVRIRGNLKSNFPDGLPKSEGEADSSQSVLKESNSPANIIVVSDVDFLTDRFSVQVQRIFGAKIAQLLNDNLNFFQNSVENLLGSDDLISVRSRGQFTRPFTKVEELETIAQQRWQQEEMVLQAQLNAANQRLSEIQSQVGAQVGADSKQVVNKAVLEEIKKFKDQRREAQERLREVRRNLRQDIERLGSNLFFLNTFFVPLLLIFGAAFYSLSKKRSR